MPKQKGARFYRTGEAEVRVQGCQRGWKFRVAYWKGGISTGRAATPAYKFPLNPWLIPELHVPQMIHWGVQGEQKWEIQVLKKPASASCWEEHLWRSSPASSEGLVKYHELLTEKPEGHCLRSRDQSRVHLLYPSMEDKTKWPAPRKPGTKLSRGQVLCRPWTPCALPHLPPARTTHSSPVSPHLPAPLFHSPTHPLLFPMSSFFPNSGCLYGWSATRFE